MDASVNAATPLVIDDMIFVSASYGTGAALLRFDEKGPEKIWAGDGILSTHYATSVYVDGFLYGFDGRQEQGPNLRCVDMKTGEVKWSEDRFGAGSLLMAGGKLLVLTEKGELIMARRRRRTASSRRRAPRCCRLNRALILRWRTDCSTPAARTSWFASICGPRSKRSCDWRIFKSDGEKMEK